VNSRLKVLLVADFGVVHSRRYLDLIRKAGCDVVLLDNRRATSFDGVPGTQYYRWPRTGERFMRYVLGARLAGTISEFLVGLQLRWLRNRTRADIAHVQWIDDRAWSFAKAGISPLVLTAWGTDLNATRDPHHDPILRRRKAEAIAKTDLLIADSQEMIETASRLAEVRVPSILLPIGIDTRMFRAGLDQEAMEWRRTLGIPDRARVVLSPRAFRRLYGHDVIVRAFARATAEAHDDAYLVFKAYDCWHRDYVEAITALAARSGIQDRIRIVDEVAYERLPVFYGMGNLAVNFPAMDAFPVTFLESLACEVPVLTKHLPAYDSLGISPYLRFTEAPTEEALVKGMAAMLSSPPTHREMAGARAYVAANFDESVIANSLGQAYRRTLDAHSKPRRSGHFTGVKQVIWTAIYRMLDISA